MALTRIQRGMIAAGAVEPSNLITTATYTVGALVANTATVSTVAAVTVAATGAVTAASITASGTVAAGAVTATGSITANTITAGTATIARLVGTTATFAASTTTAATIGTLQLTGIAQTTASTILYYDPTTKQVSYDVGSGGSGNPFNQILNTGSDVTFRSVSIASTLTVTGGVGLRVPGLRTINNTHAVLYNTSTGEMTLVRGPGQSFYTTSSVTLGNLTVTNTLTVGGGIVAPFITTNNGNSRVTIGVNNVNEGFVRAVRENDIPAYPAGKSAFDELSIDQLNLYRPDISGPDRRGSINGIFYPTAAESRTVAQGGTVSLGDVLRINRIVPDSPGYDLIYADYGPAISTGTSSYVVIPSIQGSDLWPESDDKDRVIRILGSMLPQKRTGRPVVDSDLGSTSTRWRTVFAETVNTRNLVVNTSTIYFVNNVDLANTTTFANDSLSVSAGKISINGGGISTDNMTVTNLTITGSVTGLTTASITGLSTVGYTGQYADLLGKPTIPGGFDLSTVTNQALFSTSTVAFANISVSAGIRADDAISAGGMVLDSSGLANIQTSNTQTPAMIVSNTTAGLLPRIVVRGAGQNMPGGTTATQALSQLVLESARGTMSAPTATQNGDTLGIVHFGGYDGANWLSNQSRDGLSQSAPGTLGFTAAETYTNNGVITSAAGANFFVRSQPAGAAMTLTSRTVWFGNTWTAGSTATTTPPALNVGIGQGAYANVTQTPATAGTFGTGSGRTIVAYTAAVDLRFGVTDQTSGADNAGITATNFINFVTGRRSAFPGRRDALLSGDNIMQIRASAQTAANGAGNGSIVGNLGYTMVENSGASARGTRFTVQTVNTGTTSLSNRIAADDRLTVISADTVRITDKSGSFTAVSVTTATATFTAIPVMPVFTAAGKPATGAVGQLIVISDSQQGSNPNGMLAFWDTTNGRWSYVHDNGAV